MKQSLRKCISVLLLLFCTITLCACGSRNNTSGLTDEESESWKTQTVSFVSQMTTMSDEDLESLLQYGKFYESAVSAWKDNRDVLGAYKDAGQTKCTLDGQIITVTSKMQFEKKDATVTLTINREENTPTYLSVEVSRTLGEKMKEAGGNTVLGILIVFVVLFFLSFLIYLFKYINLWVAKREQKKGGQQKPAAEAAMAPRVERQQEDVTDDTELVAVITAAIAALEQTPADSFVVRSVKKVHRNNWKRA
ncbi:OadG family protein [Ruminococcus gauvreauii]|uniref:OadG family protein n=1 Tax=Ruminococcus gauvreauii TaxID=438033 RepID=A0ABY5VII0_9FIRM|nr:OadG family protein [Ruminococcus gauvreauii]UWP59705.1 OadG family protein [Ruminococcus gauvreauii]